MGEFELYVSFLERGWKTQQQCRLSKTF